MVKITFLGDLMCKREQLRVVANSTRTFHDIFSSVNGLFESSNFVVGNLETPLAGEQLGYTTLPGFFNTPSAFAEAIKASGIDLVTTANNHCLDRGVEGLRNTIRALDKIGLKHTGTYLSEEDSRDVCVVDIGGIRFSFINFTYGTNSEFGHSPVLKKEELWMVDLSKRQDVPIEKKNVKHKYFPRCKRDILKVLPKRFLNILLVVKNGDLPHFAAIPEYQIDNVRSEAIDDPVNEDCLNHQITKIKMAKEISDVVVVLPHMGGQYNPSPGVYAKYVAERMVLAGADIVVANHSHNPLECIVRDGVPIIYSLGNFCSTPNVDWFVPGSLGEYSVVLNVYWGQKTMKIERMTYSIVKNVVDGVGFSMTEPINKIWERSTAKERERLVVESNAVARRFSGAVGISVEKNEISIKGVTK